MKNRPERTTMRFQELGFNAPPHEHEHEGRRNAYRSRAHDYGQRHAFYGLLPPSPASTNSTRPTPCHTNPGSVASFPSTSESVTWFERHSEQVQKSALAKIDMPTQEDEGEHICIEQSERWMRELPGNFDNPGHLTCPIEAGVESDDDDDQQMSQLSRVDWEVRCVSPTTFDSLLLEEISLSSDRVQISTTILE
jgi:hypothetical protein